MSNWLIKLVQKKFHLSYRKWETDIQLSTLYRLLEFGLGKTVQVLVN